MLAILAALSCIALALIVTPAPAACQTSDEACDDFDGGPTYCPQTYSQSKNIYQEIPNTFRGAATLTEFVAWPIQTRATAFAVSPAKYAPNDWSTGVAPDGSVWVPNRGSFLDGTVLLLSQPQGDRALH